MAVAEDPLLYVMFPPPVLIVVPLAAVTTPEACGPQFRATEQYGPMVQIHKEATRVRFDEIILKALRCGATSLAASTTEVEACHRATRLKTPSGTVDQFS